MQPISYGVHQQQYSVGSYPAQSYPQNYPIYPNCFDQLTTHGIVAEDVMQYITDVPSPYLQNYVAQRGWAPSMPGQIMPDPLPTLKPPQPLPKGNVYQTVYPQHPDHHTLAEEPKSHDRAKKIALSILLTGLAVLGVVKGKALVSKLFKKGTPAQPAAPATTQPWYKSVSSWFKNLFKKKPAPQPAP